jgi:mono/diheme cytochrome c family protein
MGQDSGFGMGLDSGSSGVASPDGGGTDATQDARFVDAQPADAPSQDVPLSPDDAASVDGGTAALVARGAYLVDHLIACSDCHTPKLASGAPDMTKYLAGNPVFVQLPNGDALPARNLTPDNATGLGRYTTNEIKRMFVDGIAPGGADGGIRALNPVMPYYVFHNMTNDDADAIVAYLQSIPPVNNPIPRRSAAFSVPAPADYVDPATIPVPNDSYPEKASAMRGRYLAAQSGLCIECHTEHNSGGTEVISPSKFFQGGEDFSALFAGTLNLHPVSANLTSDPTTGLGTWTTDEIVNVIVSGKDKEGTGICPPMPAGPTGAYGGITTHDAVDIANYIKSLPPVVHEIPDMCSWPPATPPPVDGGSGVDALSKDGSSG